MIATDGQWGLQRLWWVRGRRAAVRPRPLEIVLEENETWSFEVGGPRFEVVCISGEVWVTLEGDPEDHVLAAGATFSTGRKGRLAMMALRPARLGLRPCGTIPQPCGDSQPGCLLLASGTRRCRGR